MDIRNYLAAWIRLLSKRKNINSAYKVFLAAMLSLFCGIAAEAHEIKFNSTISYSDIQPLGGAGSVSNWVGATFDAGNIGGSGMNADGGDDNGTANDSYTCVANNQPAQGQTFVTGDAPYGYQLNSITVQIAGYTENIATGSNVVYWNLNLTNGPILLKICRIDGTERSVQTIQEFTAGDVNNPGAGNSVNGSGTYITFNLPFTTYLEPGSTYGFELSVGNGNSNYFELLGINDDDTYAGGTAYQYSDNTIISLGGDRVFLSDMTELSTPIPAFSHPGTLHTQEDLNRMKAKVAAGEQPWLSGYNMFLSSAYNSLSWSAYDIDWIVRGGTASQNYTRSQQDAQLLYTLTLIWHLTGDTTYADRAVYIANTWSDLSGVTGDTNSALAAGICGYLFAIGGDLLSTYPGWDEQDKQAYKDMMMRVFYEANNDYLWRHFDTFWRNGGNTHYRLNWETANMVSMAAIGILCDNQAVYEQAIDYFKNGPGNGRVERAVWYLHPGGLGQGEEAGRDQGHNLGGWHCMALLCQMAWNQGDDLFGYDNNRVLRAFEYNAKYNLLNEVPYARHQNCDLGYSEGSVSSAGRGIDQYYQYELVYNHYVNVLGLAAPWSQLAAEAARPEPWPNVGIHPSQVDWIGLGTLTYSQDPIAVDAAPTGLRANWSKNQIVLDWWGAARATGYTVKRSGSVGGPYIQIGEVSGPDLNFTDTDIESGGIYYYIVTASTPSGDLASEPLYVAQELMTYYDFEGNTYDTINGKDAVAKGGSTGLPGYNTGFGGGKAIDLDGVDDYVQLPVNSANYQDITIAAWVRWDGGNAWQRIFDFGSELEKTMFLTTKNGSGVIEWGFTTTKGGNVVGDASYYLTGPAMSVGIWTHVSVTINGDIMTLYVNGVPVDTRYNDLIDPLYGQPFCYIGKSMYNSDPLFNGRIDNFSIYNYALSGSEVWDLWGQSSNHAPVFAEDWVYLSDMAEDSTRSISIADMVEDSDGDSLAFSLAGGTDWVNVSSDGIISGTPTNDYVGENTFAVRAADSSGATDDMYVKITVYNVNDAPTWNVGTITGTDTACGLEYSGTVSGIATDVDAGDTLSYSKYEGPEWLDVAADGILSGTPGDSNAGDNVFVIKVMDSQGASDYATLVIHVDDNTTLAWWTFDEGTAGDEVPGTTGWTTYQIGTPDISGNGNHLCDYWDGPDDSGITYSANIPSIAGLDNSLAGLSEGGSYPSMFTWSSQSAPNGVDLEDVVLKSWTIEAFVYPTVISGSNRGIVGRDGKRSSTDVAAPLYFNIQSTGKLRCTYFDQAAVSHDALSSVTLSANRWYYVAVTCDGSALKLWLADLTAGATTATQVASTDVSASSDPDFGPCFDGSRGNWSVYRGYYNSGDVDRFMGSIDQVRISAAALDINSVGLLKANTAAPAFNADIIANLDAIEMSDYAGNSLEMYAQDADGIETLTFTMDSGPDWLKVAGDGALSGIPYDANVGENLFEVRVTDHGGLYDTATMTIQVSDVYSGTKGVVDLCGMAEQWLAHDCSGNCSGADLDGDNKVTFGDFSILADNWFKDNSQYLLLKFDDLTGTTATDASENGRNGILMNGPVWTEGISGGALSFDGTDDYVEVSDCKGISGNAGRTCAAWIKTSAAVNGSILSWGSDVAQQKWLFRVKDTGTIGLVVWGGEVASTAAVNDGQWHHVAVVLNSDGVMADMSDAALYIDGVQCGVTVISENEIMTVAGQDIMIGAINISDSVKFNYSGVIDDVRVYDRALTSNEIQAVYNQNSQ